MATLALLTAMGLPWAGAIRSGGRGNRSLGQSGWGVSHLERFTVWSGGIKKSAFDRREFEHLRLANGLNVVMVSDPWASQAAASMDVSMGSMKDPPSLQGLAHFLEHMLFLGSKDFPGEEEFGAYLQENSGASNAFTSMEHTNYHFHLNADGFAKALEIFSGFFHSPLMDVKSVTKEVKAVHAEHAKNLNSDVWKKQQILRTLASTGHPFNRFTTGNYSTLLPSTTPLPQAIATLQSALLQLWKANYCAPKMALVILAPLTLDQMRPMVQTHFGKVVSECTPPLTQAENDTDTALNLPYQPAVLGTVISWKTQTVGYRFSINFQIPSQLSKWQQKADVFLADLLSAQTEGSIYRVLKDKDWIRSLEAGSGIKYKSFEIFQISLSMTEKGIAEIYQVINGIFYAVAILREKGLTEAQFQSFGNLAWQRFSMEENHDPDDTVTHLSEQMHQYPPSDVVVGPNQYVTFSSEAILALLDQYIQPENMMIFVGGHNWAASNKGGLDLNRTEPIYNTPFRVDLLAPERIKGLKNPQKLLQESPWVSAISIPNPNPYLPKDLQMRPTRHKTRDDGGIYPSLLIDQWSEATVSIGKGRLFWAQDLRYGQPRANIRVMINSKLLYDDCRSMILGKVLSHTYREAVRVQMDIARKAGYRANIQAVGMRLHVSISGPTEGIEKIATLVFEALGSQKTITSESVEQAKGTLISGYTNDDLKQPHQLANDILDEIVTQPYFTKEDLKTNAWAVTSEEVTRFHQNLLDDMSVLMLVHGNSDKNDALRWFQLFSNSVKFNSPEDSLECAHTPSSKITKLLNSKFTFESKAPSPKEENSAVIDYYQANCPATENERDIQAIYFDILYALAHHKAFHSLRTVQGLGYIVSARTDRHSNVLGFKVVVQSTEHNTKFCHAAIHDFMHKSMASYIESLTEVVFENTRKSLRESYSKPPQTLSDQTDLWWAEISTEQYRFRRAIELAGMVQRTDIIHIKGFQAFYKSLIEAGHLSIQVSGHKPKANISEESLPSCLGGEQAIAPTSIVQLKQDSGVHAPIDRKPVPIESTQVPPDVQTSPPPLAPPAPDASPPPPAPPASQRSMEAGAQDF
ncbi:hypothetical protein AAMO2058_000300000 [Amorphochlora amoebiformis]